MNFRIHLFAFIAGTLLLPLQAMAGMCDVHFTFDGNLSDSGGNGYNGQMIGEKGVIATPQFVDGKYGKALQLDGSSAMRSFVDLHFDTCPEVTVTAWIQVNDGQPKGFQELVSTGSGSGPGIRVSGTNLVLKGSANGIIRRNAIHPNAGWMFVAGVYDYTNGTYTLYSRNRGVDKQMGTSRKPPEEAIWVGAFNDGLANAAANIVIDDVRIYGRLLSTDDFRLLQAGENPAAQSTIGETENNPANTSTAESGSSSTPFPIGQMPPDDQGAAIEQAADQYALQYESEEAALAAQRERDAAYQEELDLQQNELEQQRRDEAAAAAAAEADAEAQASGNPTPTAPNPEDRTLYEPVGDVVFSEVSGYAGAVRAPLEHTLGFISYINWMEKLDRPCAIQANNLDFPNFSRDTKWWSTCGRPSDSSDNVGFREAIIRSLRVCNNGRDNKRLKGIQIWGAEINTEGQRIDLPNADAEYLSNCREWGSIARCPAQHLATGIVVHANRATANVDQIVGLQLICRRIVATYTPDE